MGRQWGELEMPERGARPKVPEVQRRLFKAARALTSPLLPDDYLEMINPLWSTRELRGRIERIQCETENAATIFIRPGWEWEGHKPGQYLRLGVDIDGVRHWRAYSLTSEPDHPQGLISVTPKEDVIFGEEMRELAKRHEGLRLHEQMTGEMGHFEPAHLDELCPDWRERETFASGPGDLLNDLTEHYEREGACDRFHLERFQPIIGGDEGGEGGTVRFLDSDAQAECDGGTPILVAGEEEGLSLPYGCRMGICHTCVGTLCSGRVRDLRSGEVYGSEGERIRTCISSAEGDVEIDL